MNRRQLKNRLRRRYWRRALRFNRNVFSVTVDNPAIGMFAHLNVLIRVLRYADEHGLTPDVHFTSANYVEPGMGADWFDYHFERVHPGGRTAPRPLFTLTVKTHRDLDLSRPDDLSLRDARDLLFKYVRIKPDVIAEVDSFCARHGIGAGSLGVHYRGTDKSSESARVSYDEAIATIQAETTSWDKRPIFVASDEQRFVDALVRRFPAGSVVAYHDAARSDGSAPLHLNGHAAGNFAMGRDALVNCLILARCSRVVRTCSLLSSWASIFNPDLSVRLLNESYGSTSWFPERVIAAGLRKSA